MSVVCNLTKETKCQFDMWQFFHMVPQKNNYNGRNNYKNKSELPHSIINKFQIIIQLRKCNRWPMIIYCNMLYITAYNACLLNYFNLNCNNNKLTEEENVSRWIRKITNTRTLEKISSQHGGESSKRKRSKRRQFQIMSINKTNISNETCNKINLSSM